MSGDSGHAAQHAFQLSGPRNAGKSGMIPGLTHSVVTGWKRDADEQWLCDLIATRALVESGLEKKGYGASAVTAMITPVANDVFSRYRTGRMYSVQMDVAVTLGDENFHGRFWGYTPQGRAEIAGFLRDGIGHDLTTPPRAVFKRKVAP